MSEKPESRVSVTTYVPAYQKEQWEADAVTMGANLSEFVRMMVQAGRRRFDLSAPHVPRYELRTDVMADLRSVPGLTWNEMVEALPAGATETALDPILEGLQGSGSVIVRRGGRYVLVEE